MIALSRSIKRKLSLLQLAAALRAALKLDQLPSLDFATPIEEPTAEEETMADATA